jgi:hypothetical protein
MIGPIFANFSIFWGLHTIIYHLQIMYSAGTPSVWRKELVLYTGTLGTVRTLPEKLIS